jgi:UDP-N-acetylmuramate dehydrogenase
MTLQKQFSLKKLNTFGIEAKAKLYAKITDIKMLKKTILDNPNEKLFILGGGSNMLLTQDISALVLHIDLKGIKITQEDENHVWVTAQAGENWHEFVLWTLQHDLGGIENLSLIPGNVGTTPIQNIGAYGVEIKDMMESCTGIHTKTLETSIFSNQDCQFSYRESVFKNELKEQYIITDVTFKLTKRNHTLNTSYGAIEAELKAQNINKPTIQDVSKAVIAIRESKLPDPKKLGNSGSFFKNPIMHQNQFLEIQSKFPEMPHYHLENNMVKVPAGWLIEKAGFKGKKFGDAGIHKNQALVLVNYGNATGAEIWSVAQDIQKTILEMFNIPIEAEVNVI